MSYSVIPQDIYDFLVSNHSKGRLGYTDEGWTHYKNILTIIKYKMFNPEKPESKFVELCVAENWDYAKAVADTRNKEAIEYCDLFKKFVQHIKQTPEYIQFNRDRKINSINI